MSLGISISTGPPRPLRSRLKARRNTLVSSSADVIGSADLVMLFIEIVAL